MKTKQCKICKKVKPMSLEYFYNNGGYLLNTCKICVNKYSIEYKKKKESLDNEWVEKEKERKRNTMKKACIALSDQYIKCLLYNKGFNKDTVTQKDIDIQRNIIKLKRKLNIKTNGKYKNRKSI